MTSTELKTLLLSTADLLDTATKVFPKKLDEEVITALQGLSDQDIEIISVILKTPVTQVTAGIPNIITLLKEADSFLTSGQSTTLSGICRNLAGRPLILEILARFL